MDDVGAELGLERMVPRERRGTCLAGKEEIAALAEPDLRPLAVDREEIAGPAQEIDAVERDRDIHRRGELLADAAAGERRRRRAKGRVLLDEEHAAVEAGSLAR